MTSQHPVTTESGRAPLDTGDRPAHGEGKERREVERAIARWEERLAQCDGPDIVALEFASLHSAEGSHRFVITTGSAIEGAALLLYGPEFARLLDLPSKVRPVMPMMEQLPKRFGEIFRTGCRDAMARNVPVRVEGEVAREDGRRERFRAAFIAVGSAERPVRFTFGAFSSQTLAAMI